MGTTTIPQLPVAIALDGTEEVWINQAGTDKRTTTQAIGNTFVNFLPGMIEFIVDGSGNVVSVGSHGYIVVPFTGILTSATMLANQTGNCQMDIWACSYAQFDAEATAPTAANSITGGNLPTITAGDKYQDNALPNWNTNITTGTIWGFQVTSCFNISRITLALGITRIPVA